VTEVRKYTPEEVWKLYRGVRDPCEKCRGSGAVMYGSTSTWRGGVGGAAMTRNVCDVCWGSGDKHKVWEDLRAWRDRDQEMSREQAFKYLKSAFGATLSSLRKDLLIFADIIDKETRRRKLPEGTDEFWYKRNAEVFSRSIRRLCGEEVDEW